MPSFYKTLLGGGLCSLCLRWLLWSVKQTETTVRAGGGDAAHTPEPQKTECPGHAAVSLQRPRTVCFSESLGCGFRLSKTHLACRPETTAEVSPVSCVLPEPWSQLGGGPSASSKHGGNLAAPVHFWTTLPLSYSSTFKAISVCIFHWFVARNWFEKGEFRTYSSGFGIN